MIPQHIRNTLVWATVAVVVGGVAGLLYVQQRTQPHHAATPRLIAARAPVPAIAPLPAAPAHDLGLDDSDPVILEGLRALIGTAGVSQYVEPSGVIRRIVTTVDGLPRAHPAAAPVPIHAAIGGFIATGDDQQRTPLAQENFARYTPYIQLLSALDPRELAQLYMAHAVWFQQAYEELKHADDAPRSFRTRLAQAIDVLLAAPQPTEPVLVYRPEAAYEFADPELEHLPVGGKLMLRMGPTNATLVKDKLRALKSALATLAP